MPRKYYPKPGAKTLHKYDENIINLALREISAGKSSIRSIAGKHGIPYSVLQRHNKKVMKPHGGQTALTPEAEAFIIQNLNICADWGYPLDQNDLRYIVKMYLDTSNVKSKRFKNNYPGPDFVESFLKRHSDKISKRISQNIKRSRAAVSPEIMKTYFDELEKSLEGVPHSNIVNYDETNLSDDPGRPKVIVRRGCKYPERVRNFSKGCTSLMMAANAEGELLVPYVVYKSTYLYDTWTENGPQGTWYNRSSSGWFDGEIFSDWVINVIIPYFDKKSGKKVLIGDNLSSHLSAHLIDLCKEKDIHFVFLPPNSTHLTQPLDVAFFRPMKQAWRNILQKWKQSDGRNSCSIPKGCFPRLLKLLINDLKNNSESNIRSGFKKTGIVPLNSEEVLSRLPNAEIDGTDPDAVNESFVKYLKEMRYGTLNISEPKKKKKLNVVAGRSVCPDELNNENVHEGDEPNESGSRQKKKGLGKKSKPQPSNNRSIEKLIPVSLNTQTLLNPKPSVSGGSTPTVDAILDMDIESMPIVLEEDLPLVEREEIFEGPTETEKENIVVIHKNISFKQVNKNQAKKESKIKILSDEIVAPNRVIKKKKADEIVACITKKPKTVSTLNAAAIPSRRDSTVNLNYLDNAEEILKILEDD